MHNIKNKLFNNIYITTYIILVFTIIYLRRPDQLLAPYVWAEDATFFYDIILNMDIDHYSYLFKVI